MSGTLTRTALERLALVAAEPEDDPFAGFVLGNYRCAMRIGRGGSSAVYRATDLRTGAPVALKILDDAVAAGGAPALARQVERSRRLDHPGFAAARDHGRACGPDGTSVSYLAQDLVEGRSLERAWPELDRETHLAILLQVARAIGHAHARGLVHQDLTCRNVLVTRDRRAVIADLGLMREVAPDTTDRASERATDASQSGERTGGTPRYMAPEQVQGAAVGPPADVWALGVLLYQVLTGGSPFGGANAAQVQLAILRAPFIPPRALDPTIPRALDAVCRAALARDPRNRYPDGNAFADDLARALAGTPTRARAPWIAVAWLAAHPARAAALALATIALIAGALALRAELAAAAGIEPLRLAARAEHATGRWHAALELCERALARSNDPELTRLAAELRATIAREDARDEAARADAARTEELAPTLRTVSAHLERTRYLFHVAGCDIAAHLARTEALLDTLEAQHQADPATEAREHLTLLGQGHLLVGRLEAAERLLLRADLLTHGEDAWVSYLLGRVVRHRAIGALVEEAARGASAGWSRPVLRRLARSLVGWDPATPLDRQLARAVGALAEGRDARAAALCREGTLQFRGAPGAEELEILYALASAGDERRASLTRAIEHCPHLAWALVLRAADHLARGEHQLALADLDRAIDANRWFGLALRFRARARAATGAAEAAAADLARAIEVTPREELGPMRADIDALGPVCGADRVSELVRRLAARVEASDEGQ